MCTVTKDDTKDEEQETKKAFPWDDRVAAGSKATARDRLNPQACSG